MLEVLLVRDERRHHTKKTYFKQCYLSFPRIKADKPLPTWSVCYQRLIKQHRPDWLKWLLLTITVKWHEGSIIRIFFIWPDSFFCLKRKIWNFQIVLWNKYNFNSPATFYNLLALWTCHHSRTIFWLLLFIVQSTIYDCCKMEKILKRTRIDRYQIIRLGPFWTKLNFLWGHNFFLLYLEHTKLPCLQLKRIMSSFCLILPSIFPSFLTHFCNLNK